MSTLVTKKITDHTRLKNIGTNTHAQIDTHIASVTNPHSTSDANLVVTDVTTNNASTSAHGFAPKLSNDPAQFYNGQGNWVTPSGTANAYISQAFTSETSVVVNHNFGAYPVVQVIVSNDVFIPFTITHASVNQFTVTFSNSTSGTIVASVGSPQLNNFTTAPGNYSVTTDDKYVEASGSGSTITLHTAVGYEAKVILVKNTSAGNITVDTTSSQTIDGDLTVTLTPNEALEVLGNGANWLVI